MFVSLLPNPMERGGYRGRGDRGRGGYGGGRGGNQQNQYQDRRFSGERQGGDQGNQPNYGGYGRGGGEEPARGGYGGRGRGRGGNYAYPRDQGGYPVANEGGDGYGGGRGSNAGGGRGGGGRGRQQQYQYQQQDQRVSGDVRAQTPGIPATRQGGEDVRSSGGYGGRGGGGGAWSSVVSQSQQPPPARSVPVPAPAPIQDVTTAMQPLRVSGKMPSSSDSKESSNKTVPVRRPDNGGKLANRTVRLRVNHFPVRFNPQSTIRHYDIDVKPDEPQRNGRPVKIPKADMAVIRKKLFADNPNEFPLAMTAYDGEKNIFSAVYLPEGKFKVQFGEGEDMKYRSYEFSIKLVNELKLSKLKDYLSRNLFSIPRDILQGMDVVMKENPAEHMINVGRSFHFAEPDRGDDLQNGLVASRGIQHSLKPTHQGLALCLDYSVLAFRKKVPVLDFLHEHIQDFNLNNFERFRRPVELALKDLKVTVTHRLTKQKYTVIGLTKDKTRNLSFQLQDPDGVNAGPQRVSLVDYFMEKHGKPIDLLNIPCLDVSKGSRVNYLPMEFCVLAEGQIFSKDNLEKYDRDAAGYLKEISLVKPRERARRISEMVNSSDGPCSGKVIQNFGIEVSKNMTSVSGRVIGPPMLKLSGSTGKEIQISVDRDKCQWNLLGKAMAEGRAAERWAVLDFTSDDRYRFNCNQFTQKLIAKCRSLGMKMGEALFTYPTGMNKFSNVEVLREVLEDVSDRARKSGRGHLQLLVCVMSRKDDGYKYLKWISETKLGMVTQCCLSSNIDRRGDQYLSNLAMKINAKLGGSNVELSDQLPYFKGNSPVMFIGADVNHPGAHNKSSPSIAAVVATVNWPAANRYAARVRPQEHRKEKIQNFGEMCLELVGHYASRNKVRPEKIVIFRDGVSEGQFDMVLNEELVDLKNAFLAVNYNPTITLIVAQKRHQTRLFPESDRDGCSTGNVPPGTVVDTTIVHPFEFDFYLCSHYGSLGTSKPTHYHVLWDEHDISSDDLQRLIYNMCFTFSRCTKPVSLVPPVYYADLVAYRGRLYHEALTRSQLGSASSTSSSLSSSASSFDERFFKLHTDLENAMFFV